MEVHLPEQQEAELNELSAETGRGTEELLVEAVGRLLADSDRLKHPVAAGEPTDATEEEEADRIERILGRWDA